MNGPDLFTVDEEPLAPFVLDEPFDVEPEPAPDITTTAIEDAPRSNGGTLQVLDPQAGELVTVLDASQLLSACGIPDLTTATDEDLARYGLYAGEFRLIMNEADGNVSEEWITRLDREAKWTRHGVANGIGYKVAAPSPEAGTTAHDTDLLLAALTDGVERGVISQDAADAALQPLTPDAPVSYDLLAQVRAALANELMAAAEELLLLAVDRLLAQRPKPRYQQRPAGIKALLKNPAMKAAIEACQVKVTPPARRAKVTQVRKEN